DTAQADVLDLVVVKFEEPRLRLVDGSRVHRGSSYRPQESSAGGVMASWSRRSPGAGSPQGATLEEPRAKLALRVPSRPPTPRPHRPRRSAWSSRALRAGGRRRRARP